MCIIMNIIVFSGQEEHVQESWFSDVGSRDQGGMLVKSYDGYLDTFKNDT